MQSQRSQSKLYRYFIFYFITNSTAFVFIYALFSNTFSTELRRFMILPVLISVFLITNLFLMYLLKKVFILNRKHEKIEMELLKYQYLESDLKMYRQHRHDMKNHLTVIYELVNDKKYDDLKDYTSQYLDQTTKKLREINTGTDEVDVLIYHKLDSAKNHLIETEFHCNTNLLISNQSVIDIVSIFSNLLDNAIEANKRIASPNDRMISIAINEDQLDYVFIVTNAFFQESNPNQFLVDGFTTKSDRMNHGLGLGIIHKLVEKYSGNTSVEVFNEKFYQVTIDIPKHTL